LETLFELLAVLLKIMLLLDPLHLQLMSVLLLLLLLI
jgi:hypothetical protein